MSQAQLVLIIPVGGADLPGFGGGWGGGARPDQGLPGRPDHITGWPVHPPGHPDAGLPIPPVYVNGKPVYPPGHPSQGLPIQPGHPDHGLPGSGGHPSHGLPPGGVVAPPINLPPNVIWPPQFPPTAGNLPAPPTDVIGPNPPAAPAHPIAPGAPLPDNAAFVAVYTTAKGWQSTVIKAPPATATPK